MYYYQAEIHSLGLAADLRINDLPIYKDDGTRGGGSIGGVVNDSVVDGHNTVNVVLHPLPGHPHITPGSLISIKISELQSNGDVVTLYTYQWKAEDAHTPLLRAHGGFVSQTHFGLLAWQRATPVILDAATEAGVRTLIVRLHEAMDTKNLAQMTALLTIKARDGAVLSGPAEAAFVADQESYFRQKFAQPGWRMQPLEAGLRYQLYGEGRVVNVTDAQGREVLRSRPDHDGVMVGVTASVSLLDGQWTITR